MFKKTKFNVLTEQDLVVIMLGNAKLKMSYNDAFIFSQAIALKAKRAKMWAGDYSKVWNVQGDLKDLEQNYRELIKPNGIFSAPKGTGGGR